MILLSATEFTTRLGDIYPLVFYTAAMIQVASN